MSAGSSPPQALANVAIDQGKEKDRSQKIAISEQPKADDAAPQTGKTRLNKRVSSITVWLLPTLVTFGIVRWGAGRPVLGWDESMSWGVAVRTREQIFALASNIDAAITPYYLFMHYWIKIFGDSETSVRTPSMLAIAGAAGFIAAIGHRLFNARVGIIAGLLFAITPSVSRYGQEMRPYAIALFLAAMATWLLIRNFEKASTLRWIGYGITIALLGLAHLLGLFLLLGHAALVAFHCYTKRSPKFAIPWLITAIAGALVCTPLVAIGHDQRSQLYWIEPMRWNVFFDFPNAIFGIDYIGWFIVGLALMASWHVRHLTTALIIGILGPVLCLYGLAYYTPLWIPRYILYVLIVLCLLAAVSASTAWWRIGVIFTIMLVFGYQAHLDLREVTRETPNYRALANVIAETQETGDGVIYSPALPVWSVRQAINYYIPEDIHLRDVLAANTPAENAQFYPKNCAPVEKCLAKAQRLWVISPSNTRDPYVGFDGQTYGYLWQNFTKTSEWRFQKFRLTMATRKQ